MSKSLQDFEDFLKLLNEHRVSFVVVGAHAMSHWGYTRATGDLDILVVPSKDNSKHVHSALREFGVPMKKIKEDDFCEPEQVLQIGVPPLRIDILTSIDGVTAANALDKAKSGTLLGQPVRILGLNELIRNKRSLGRPKDLLDVAELMKLKRKK